MLIWLALAVVGLVALGITSFWLVVRPPRMAIPLTPADFALRVEDVRIRAADGVTLAGWLIARPTAPAVVLLHGYPANKADLLPIAAALAPRFAVLLMDLRYFGDSGGRATTLGFRERGDLQRAVAWLHARGYARVGVFGFSLGGAVALLAAADDPGILAVAAYAPFADLRLLGRETYGPLVHLMRISSLVLLGADITRPAPVDAAARLKIPVLLIASRQDEQIGFHHAELLRAALGANSKVDFHVLERGRHGEAAALEPTLRDFFVAHL